MAQQIRSIVSYVVPTMQLVDQKTGRPTEQAVKWLQGIQQTLSGLISFGSGVPTGVSTEAYIYFDTSVTPYQGYVYHSAAWNKFS